MLDDSLGCYLRQIGVIALLGADEEVELARRIEAGLLAGEKLAYLGDAEEHRTLAQELRWLSADGARAKSHFVCANLRLVVSIAKRFTGRGLPFPDLIQEGNLGLIRAVERFDYATGLKFSTNATWLIRQSIARALANQTRTIRLPAYVGDMVDRVASARCRLLLQLGREPTLDELSRDVDLTALEIIKLQQQARAPWSLDSSVRADFGDGPEIVPFGWTLADADALAPLDRIERADQQRLQAKLLGCLPEREAEIIRLRYGLSDDLPRTLGQIGQALGLSRERIRQLESRSMNALRLRVHR